MPRSLSPIPLGAAIVEQNGTINAFFRQLWEDLRAGFLLSSTVANVSATGQTAAVATTAAYTTLTSGTYRVSWYLRKTVADGVSSSVQLTLGWTDLGLPLTEASAAVTTDTTGAQQSGSKVVTADANTDLTFAFAYASNTPAKMTFHYCVVVELLA